MQVIFEVAKRVGLNTLPTDKYDLEGINWISEVQLSRQAIMINAILNGKLPVDERLTESLGALNNAESFSLTDIQYAYLIGRNPGIVLGGIATNYYLEMEVFKPDLERLNIALNNTIKLHPMLRATLAEGGRQKILSELPFYSINTTDCSDWEIKEKEKFLTDTRYNMQSELRELDKAPPFDIRATYIDKCTLRLHLSFELMFLDFHSVQIVLRDWWRYYQSPVSYKFLPEFGFEDYIEVERLLDQKPQGLRDRDFWHDKIENMPPFPELPLSKSPELISTHKIKKLTREISTAVVNKLRMIVGEKGIMLETLFLGAYIETLRQWSKRQDFTLTLTQHSRRAHFDKVENVVGNFLQSSLFSVTSSVRSNFTERLIELQTELLLNRCHSCFNGIRVLREMTRRAGNGRPFSMPIVFSNTLNADLRDIVTDYSWDGTAKHIYNSTQTPQVWLENQIVRVNDIITINWNYVDELFPNNMLDNMLDACIHIIEECAYNPEIWDMTGIVVNLPEADLAERERANDTAVELNPCLLHEMILNAAQQYPDKVAIVQGDRHLRFGELVAKAQLIAHHIRNKTNIAPGDIVAISFPQGSELIVGILGALIAGAAYVSIDPALPPQRRNRLLERCMCKAVVTSIAIFSDVDEFGSLPRINIDNETSEGFVKVEQVLLQKLDDLAYVIFTSGSTGEPKGVMITHRNASNTILDINRRFNVNETDVVFSVAPAGFDLSVYDYFGVLGAGGCLVFNANEASNDPKIWAEEIVRNEVTIWNSVPAPVKALVECSGDFLAATKLRLVLMSGDWIPVDLPNQIKALIPEVEVISLGGATEGSIWSIFYPIKEVSSLWKSIPYGNPLANQKFYVMNDWFSPSPKWVTGELYIAGEGVAQGYLADPEKTEQRFIIHPATGERLYKTGDLGRYIDNGLIEILGREDNQVKINGYRIEPGEIEASLLTNEMASHVVIDAPIHPKTGQKQLVAYVVINSKYEFVDKNLIQEKLKETIKEKLPSYMMPTFFVVLPAMPLTSNGKIDRNSFPVPWADFANDCEKNTPANDIEARLFILWSKQLQHEDFDVTSGFFDIGGDSLHAVGLLSAVREEFNVSAKGEQDMIEGLFMNVNIRDFARIIMAMFQTEKGVGA
ncbi:non-ribosomal peptide synthetase [Photorhabdus viridis]|uniref:non-ribosomal peptide synthetase n=1 Tax=Photorhabdus viridis TaxID=3163327 RepID=UPI00330763DD